MADEKEVVQEVSNDIQAVEKEAPAEAPAHTERMLSLLENILALLQPKTAEEKPAEKAPIASETIEVESTDGGEWE